jgi:energy-coupling factor transporter ATP-binding protein EcfA2
MRYVNFVIQSFKGIKRAEINLARKPEGSIYTLVGLNESGKTTILEAINSFSPDRDGVAHIFDDIVKEVKPKDLVPKGKKSNFTGTIMVEAHLELDDQDKIKILSYAKSTLAADIDPASIPQILRIQKNLDFKDSDYTQTRNIWNFRPKARTKGQRRLSEIPSSDPVWQSLVKFIQDLIPTISYFPTFLFDFPDRIYLSNPPASINASVNKYYVQIVQDVLDYLGDGMNIATHIVGRAERPLKEGLPWDFINFWKSDYKEQISHVMIKIGSAISQVIFERWNEIFGSQPTNKSIDVDWGVEPRQDGKRSVYLKFQIQEWNVEI